MAEKSLWLIVHDRKIVDTKQSEDAARECAERNSINGNDGVAIYQYVGTCKPKRVAEWVE